MIAVTSHRPLIQCSNQIAQNQLRAVESWLKAFSHSCYFGPPEPAYDALGFHQIPSEPFPKIIRLARFCASLPGWSALVNADIVIGPNLTEIEHRLDKKDAMCAVSWRYEFDLEPAMSKVVDVGMDFFAARQEVWKEVGKIYPEEYRIGHSSWDAMMLGAFNIVAKSQLYDLTHHRLVFHPKHEDRQTPHFIKNDTQTECRDNVSWPSKRLF